jgi:hypothetical protein
VNSERKGKKEASQCPPVAHSLVECHHGNRMPFACQYGYDVSFFIIIVVVVLGAHCMIYP